MAVSKLLPAGGVNDFSVDITSTNTTVSFSKEYPIGAYAVTYTLSDTTYDIYAINANGIHVGYTKGALLTVTGGFNKLVIVGQTTGNLIEFRYKSVYTASDDSSNVDGGPAIVSTTSTDLPNINDTITITGRNFASDITAAFTGTGYSSTSAKTLVRTNASSLIITRPDNMPTSGAPYTLTLTNPGITAPTGSNLHILSNAITVGNSPVWSTSATLPVYTKDVAYSQTVTATDSDGGSAITYSTISNSLPTGLSITGSGNVISGTPTVLTSGSVTIRATDSGGNYVDRTFTIANIGADAPVFTSSQPSLPASGQAYTYTATATDDSGSTPDITFNSGTLPTGLSWNNSTKVISGTTTDTTPTSFTLRATDANGTYTDLVVTGFRAASLVQTAFTSSGTFTPVGNTINNVLIVGGGGGGGATNQYSNGGSGGGGGGMVREFSSISVTAGQAYPIVVGSGAPAANLNNGQGSIAHNGNKSSAFGYESFGGQGGMNCGNGWSQPRTSELGPGGGNASYGFGYSGLSAQVVDQGYKGNEVTNSSQGGGGGAANAGNAGSVLGANGTSWSINGQAYGGGGAGGPGGYNGGSGGGGQSNPGGGSTCNATYYGGGGGGLGANAGTTTYAGSGYNGIVIVYAFQ